VKGLIGKCAWVTGGASGIGRATALALADAGADVVIGSLVATQRDSVLPDQNCHTPTDDELFATKEEIQKRGVRGAAFPLDVVSAESIATSYQSILSNFGKVDILINAAGTSARKPIINHPDEIWNRVIDVNLTGPYRTIKTCFAGMVERRWGRIVNVSSTAANSGYPLYSAYCASKSGLVGLTRCVALEGAAYGVTCNAICPGFVETEQCNSALRQEIEIKALGISLEQYKAQIVSNLPQSRFLTPEEVAALIVYLCREEALGIEGQAITIAMGSQW
jgi:3-hydroxybutyrate dehydrogenase